MKLNELTMPNSIPAAKRVLQDAGYDQIGDGSNALVFARYGEPFVLKLFHNTDNGFKWFLSYVKSHPSPFWPVMRSRMIRVTSGYSAVRMERLAEISESYNYRLEDVLNELVWCVEHEEDAKMMARVRAELPSAFIDAVMAMLRKADRAKKIIDLHPGNVMMRGNTMVVTDPLSA